jgi:hypothetical protein
MKNRHADKKCKMAITLNNPEANNRIAQLQKMTGLGKTAIVIQALTLYEEHLSYERSEKIKKLNSLASKLDALPDINMTPPNQLLYTKDGLPKGR